ncbi:hypothetical protein RQP46_002406 [Phenoliferia psychrophenolica]
MSPTHVRLLKFPVSSPADTTPLAELKRLGHAPSSIVGVIGKTEGNGCVNDFSRTLSAMVWEAAIDSSAIAVFSGGTEGVLSPHVSILVKEENTGLVAAVGKTRVLAPVEVGAAAQAHEVAKTIKELMAESDLHPADVHLILVKCPLLTSTKMEAIRLAGLKSCASDTYESMGKSRYATAVGIAAALGEVDEASIDSAVLVENTVWSAKASCSSGAELDDCHILILATPSGSSAGNRVKATSTYMKDAMDAEAILRLLNNVKSDNGRVLQVFAKAEASPDGLIRGKRHTMLTDSDLHSTRHARAAVGGLVAGLTGQPDVYVSGGAEGQGPPGGGSLCIVYEVDLA